MGDESDSVLQRTLDNPPVLEAVAGIEFRPRGSDVVNLVHESDRWTDRYPIASAQGSLPSSKPAGQPGPEFEMQLMNSAPPTRLWTAGPDQRWLVQTQDDRLVLNWRRLGGDQRYPGYHEAIRPEFERLLALIDRPAAGLIPLVAEYSYINLIDVTVPGLHETYSVFRKPSVPLPGDVAAEKYEVITNVAIPLGFAQMTATIKPGSNGPASTTLTVSTKAFAGAQLSEAQILDLIDSAHNVSKMGFFAIVSEDTTSQWGAADA